MVIWRKPRRGCALFLLSMWHVTLVLLFQEGGGGLNFFLGGRFLLPPSWGHHNIHPLSIDPMAMEAMLKKIMDKMTNKLACACVCVYVFACISCAFGVGFLR